MHARAHSSQRARGGLRATSLCVLLALLAWSGALARGGFAFDDAEAVHGNPVVEGGAPWTAAFLRDYWDHVSPAGHYRPLATLSLRMDHALWGLDAPLGWHATNVALHAAVVLLLGLTLLLLDPRGPAQAPLPWAGVALFAVHPALADSVAWISGRSSMLSAGAGLLGAVALAAALRADRRRGPVLALAAALGLLGALLGKEDGIVFAAVYAFLALRAPRRDRLATVTGMALALVAYLLLRAQALGSPVPSAPHAPLDGEPLGTRLLVAGRALLELTRLAALPVGYPPNYDRAVMLQPPGIDAGPSWTLLALLGWLPWLALVLLGARAMRRRSDPLPGASALLAALSLVPILQLVPAGAVLAPRFLYLPLMLAAPLVHAAALRIPVSVRRPAVPLVLVACVIGCWSRAAVYADRASYHLEVLAQRPLDAPAWNQLGLAREEAGDLTGARQAFERAARLDPGYSRPWSNLGRLALARGDQAEAERCLVRAVELGPVNAVAHVNLGAFLLGSERPLEAIAAYRRAVELAPRLGPAWRGLGRALAASARPAEARPALERALRLDPSDERARRALERLESR